MTEEQTNEAKTETQSPKTESPKTSHPTNNQLLNDIELDYRESLGELIEDGDLEGLDQNQRIRTMRLFRKKLNQMAKKEEEKEKVIKEEKKPEPIKKAEAKDHTAPIPKKEHKIPTFLETNNLQDLKRDRITRNRNREIFENIRNGKL